MAVFYAALVTRSRFDVTFYSKNGYILLLSSTFHIRTTLFLSIIRFIFVETDNYLNLCKNETMENYEPKPIEDCYHIFSDGTRVVVLCDTEEDHVYMMNQLAVAAHFCHLDILSLEVMRTHFHMIARGGAKHVEKYRREVKRLIVRRYNRDGLGELVKDSISIALDKILTDEELRRKIIYVFRNCTEAGYEYLPEDYPWGPGRVYCHTENESFKKVGNLSYNEACRLFRTRVKLPSDWEYDEKGMLIPSTYINKEYLRNAVFRSPRQFIAFLSVKKKDLAEMEAADARPFLERRDESKLLKEVEQASLAFRGVPVKKLSQADRIALATRLWSERKTTSIKQLSRLTRSNVDVLREVLHIPKKE